MEETYVMIKPDGYELNIFDEVVRIFNENGLNVSDVRTLVLDEDVITEHYSHLTNFDFFPHLRDFMLSGPVIAMTVTGIDAVKKVRALIGATNPTKAEEGTIRFMYGDKVDTTRNVIHASDSVENAQIEIKRFKDYEKRINGDFSLSRK